MCFYKRDGFARHIEANKSTPQWKARQPSAIVLALFFVLCFCMRICVCVHMCACAHTYLCVSVHSPQRSGSPHTATIVASLSAFPPSASQCLSGAGEEEGKREGALLSWTGRRGEGVRRSKGRGGDASLGRLLGAGREAPIIVAGDRNETSPSNPSSSACKSCHRGSTAAPRASHPVCQHPSWGTETRGPSGPEGQQDQS